MADVRRKIYSLDDTEFFALQYRNLLDYRAFWQLVAEKRGLDPESILHLLVNDSLSRHFTALPLGHGKPWCWPIYPLKCEKRPHEIDHAREWTNG